jgi:hypothetical protein
MWKRDAVDLEVGDLVWFVDQWRELTGVEVGDGGDWCVELKFADCGSWFYFNGRKGFLVMLEGLDPERARPVCFTL